MGKLFSAFGIFLAGSILLSGCMTQEKSFPAQDEVLLYALPFDLTYLRTMEAIDSHPDWELSYSEKEKGIITVRNIHHSSLTDADKRIITFMVKRVDRHETSVQLAPDSQYVIGGDELLKLVGKYLSNEL